MGRSLAAAAQTRAARLRYSYLFLPGLMSLAFTALAGLLVWADLAAGAEGVVDVFPAGASAARTVLSVIAGSLITVAGVAFSITIVSLQLVSQQFTPRALRTFLGDRLNQAVAGFFIGIFLYCLVVLTAVKEGDDTTVPGLSMLVALVLAAVALGMLLVFIDHMAHAIQVSEIASRVAHQTLQAAAAPYPSSYGTPLDEDPADVRARWEAEREPLLVFPERPGFVETVDDIPGTIGGRGFRIALLVKPGDFVTENHPLAAVWPSAGADGCEQALRRAVAVAAERDLSQDIAYGIRQLTDIAVRALSPSVNDPTTATTCIGYIQAILERLASTELPPQVRVFPDQDVTLLLPRHGVESYLESLLQISRYAADARVADALLRATLRVAEAGRRGGHDEWARAAAAVARRIHDRATERGVLDRPEQEALDRLLEQTFAV
ncbi:MAG TPA: DUF2254 domain-containing protein [Gaiellaceae bacterium]|nr:DUF2254 domain-containing protein [Gaiellaceae bacterium]